MRCGNVLELDSNGKSPSSNLQQACYRVKFYCFTFLMNTTDMTLHLKLVILELVSCVTRNV